MNPTFRKKALPHFIAVLIFLVVAVIYCQPALQGKVLNQNDTRGWRGMAQQSFEFKEKYGHYPYWTNSMFGGMPGYQIAFETPNKISIGFLHNYIFTLGLPIPIGFFFLASLMMYYLLMVLRVNPWIGVMGALCYAYSTYDPVIIAVGHNTKMICIGYAPAVIASLLLIFQRKYVLGAVLTALFAAMIVWQNHVQITFYTLITALCIGIAYGVYCFREKTMRHFIISAALAAVAGALALGVNTINIWPMNEYAKETMRGGRSELKDPASPTNKSTGGLDKDYAFMWSYGISETLTFLVPDVYGGSNGGTALKSGDSKFAEKVVEGGMPEENGLSLANGYAYWGGQPSTSGPVYLGAIICFLFILGMVYVKHWIKWGIFAACLIGVLLAWGSNFAAFNYFIFDHFPLYNKFRAPTMALVIPQLGFVMLAALALHQILFSGIKAEEAWKKFKLGSYITGGFFALLILMYFTTDYTAPKDAQLKQSFVQSMTQPQGQQAQQPTPQVLQQAEQMAGGFMTALREDRQSLFGKDLFRSLFLVVLAGACIALFLKNRLKPVYAMAAISILASGDLLAVGKRYLSNENFVEPTDFESYFIPNAADLQIKADPDKNFRVFDQTAGSPFEDARASYHHNSIGGYSPAKLALYQDLIQRQLSMGNMETYNMLNARYFITQNPANGQPIAQKNPGALGNAWFVKNLRFVNDAEAEMNALTTLQVKDSAVADKRFQSQITTHPQADSASMIRLIENLNDKLTYESVSSKPGFAVFSEIYYPHGWDAYVDGQKTNYIRVNYLLRGMQIPAGNHKIEFRFEPRSVILGDKITMWLSILLYVVLIGGLVYEFRKSGKQVTSVKA
jgi:hypothetical protein